MASELVRRVWCDVHAANDGEQVPAAEAGQGIVLRVGELAGAVDVCERCLEAHITPIADWIEQYARAAPNQPPAKTNGGGGQGAPFRCSDCGRTYAYRGSLKNHVKDAHGRILPALRKSGGPVTCPHCRKEFQGAQGLSAHIRAHHPEKWTGSLTV